MIQFVVPGVPVGKGRPRAARVGRSVRMYTPEKTRSYEDLVAWHGKAAMQGRAPLAGTCVLTLQVRMPVPVSWSKRRQAQALSGAVRPGTKPDLDNVVKAIGDSLNGIVWADDAQIVGLMVEKFYSESPGVTVRVHEC